MYELKISLDQCSIDGRRLAIDAIRLIAEEAVGKRAVLAEALLNDCKEYCTRNSLPQRAVQIPCMEANGRPEVETRDIEAARDMGFVPGSFSHDAVDTLTDFVCYLSAIPPDDQVEFADGLIEIIGEASEAIDLAIRKENEGT